MRILGRVLFTVCVINKVRGNQWKARDSNPEVLEKKSGKVSVNEQES